MAVTATNVDLYSYNVQAVSPYISQQDTTLLQQLLNIIQRFSSVTKWDTLILCTQQDINSYPDFTSTDSYFTIDKSTQPIEPGNLPSGWQAIAGMIYVSMSSKDGLMNSNDMMTNITQMSYLNVFKELCTQVCNVKGSFYNNNYFDSLIQQVNASADKKLNKLEDFLLSCKNVITKLRETTYSEYDKRVFIVCFRPFLIALFIINNIFIKDVGASVNISKSDVLLVQYQAVLTFRVYMMQTMMLLLQLVYPTTSANLTKVTSVIDNEINLVGKLVNVGSNDAYFTQVATMLSENQQGSQKLYSMTSQIDNMKSNLEKAVVKQLSLVSQERRSFITMWVWISVMILFLAVCIVSVVITLKK
jgi:hypothetical protein